MKIGGRFDLVYCSNIHAGERWAEVDDALRASLPNIRRLLNVQGAFGIGLRLSAAAARDLEEPRALAAFRQFLGNGQYYVATINGFPFGAFHGTRVKERVYLPDWRSAERVDYTNRLARLLSTLASDGGADAACISTVPGAFHAAVSSDADMAAVTKNVLAHAAYLVRLREETGVTISLAIEPEPACVMETASDAASFFERALIPAVRDAGAAGDPALTEQALLRHVGLCLDACHMAVEFEDPAAALDRVLTAGIRVFKMQLSSAVRLVRRPGDPPASAVLGPFAEDTYLHQVVTCDSRGLTRYSDLPEALASERPAQGEEWRVHFHVPIFLASMSGFETTQPYLAQTIDLLGRTGACRCLEVETYTWDVLPPEYRTSDVCTAIARELAWVRDRLLAS